jgi:CRISPR/Cas system CMR-associated protein Cmr5 small subunit
MTRQQVWANAAFEAVLARKEKDGASKFATYCMRGPNLMRQSGLVQALAFLLARAPGDRMAREYVDAVARALEPDSNARALLDRARKADLAEYLFLSRSAVGVALWLRRFAQSELDAEVT